MDTVLYDAFYDRLVYALPMDDTEFIKKLKKEQIIADDYVLSSEKKAQNFLEHVIKHSLIAFEKLLTVMEDYDNKDLQQLAKQIISLSKMIPIHIKYCNSETSWVLHIEVKVCERIRDVKAKIQEEKGIRIEDQILIHACKEWEDETRISSLGLPIDSTIEMKIMKIEGTVDINVRITTGKNFPLSVIVSDTIKDVKAKIQEKEGIQPNEQILTFERKKMIDERTLSQYGIQKGSTVVLTIDSLTQSERHSLESINKILGEAISKLRKIEEEENDGKETDISLHFRTIMMNLSTILDDTCYLLHCHFANNGEVQNIHDIKSQCGFPFVANGVKVSESDNQDQKEKFKKKHLPKFLSKNLGKASQFWKYIGDAILEVQPKLIVNSSGDPVTDSADIIHESKEESFAILHDFRNENTHQHLSTIELCDTWAEYDQSTGEQRIVQEKKSGKELFYQKLKKSYWIKLPNYTVRKSVHNYDRLLVIILDQLVTFVKDISGKLLAAAFLLPQNHGIPSYESSANVTIPSTTPEFEFQFNGDYVALKEGFIEQMRRRCDVTSTFDQCKGVYSLEVDKHGENMLRLSSNQHDESAAVKEVMEECIRWGIIKLV